MKKQNLFYFSGIITIWFLSYLWIYPIGDFSTIDSWFYAYPIRSLLEEGSFRLPHLTSANAFIQISLGWTISKLFGQFSFDYLRLITFFIAASGSFCFFLMIKDYCSSRKLRIAALLLFIFQPLYFLLSFTFMTDVYFCALGLWACWSFQQFLKKEKTSFGLLFILFASLCFMNRQTGLFFFPAALLTLIFEKKMKPLYWFPLILIPIGLYLFTEALIKPSLGVSEYYYNTTAILKDKLLSPTSQDLKSIVKRIMATIFYLGFWSIPLAVLIFKRVFSDLSIRQIFLSIILLLTGTYLGTFGQVFSPDRGNMFYNFGLGPQLLKDIFIEKQFSDTLHLGLWFEYPAIFLGLLSFLSLSLYFWKKWKLQKLKNPFINFIFIFNLILIPFSFLFHSFFDRYLLFSILSLLILFFMAFQEEYNATSHNLVHLMVFILCFGFSLLATKDYFSWQKAKSQAFTFLDEKNIPIQQIDAGYEINGWLNAYLSFESKAGKAWWFVEDDDYCLSFGPIEGYSIINHTSYFRFLTLKKEKIFILKKTNTSL